MYKLWKMSTIAFVLQLVIAGIIYLTMADDSFIAMLSTAIFIYTVFAIASLPRSMTIFGSFVGAAIVGFVVLWIGSPEETIDVFFLVCILVVGIAASLMADSARIDGAKENYWPLFVTALYGIGPLVGGILLLRRRLQRRRVSAP